MWDLWWQNGTGTGLLISPIAPQPPSSIIWGWYNRPVVAVVPSGLSLTAITIIIINY
jgi:hypothetical protein